MYSFSLIYRMHSTIHASYGSYISLTLCTVYLCNPYNDSEICSSKEKGNIVLYARHGSIYSNHRYTYIFFIEVSVFSRWREKSNCVEQLDIYTAANQFVLDSKPKKHSHMLQLSIKIIPYVELTLVRLNLFPMECTSIIVTTFATTFNSDYLDMFTPRRNSDTDTDLKK